MQTFIRETILYGVELTYINTDKFKTGYLSACLNMPLKKATASKNAVLPFVLRRGTSTHTDMEQIAAALDELYGAKISPVVRKRGEAQLIGFSASFVDDNFIPEKADVFEKVSSLMAEMLLYPNTVNGRLKEEYVKSEKANLISEIKGIINNKQLYANNRLLQLMYKNEPYSINRLGSEAEAQKISVATLTKHYHDVLRSSRIEMFYCGSLPFARVKEALLSAFSALPRTELDDEIITEATDIPADREVKTMRETMEIGQGKLAMGIRMGKNYHQMSYAAFIVFNAVYGGVLTSKLFTNVRERLSLCYYASSSADFLKGVMIVASGIDKEKYDEAVGEILAQLECMKAGEITEAELENAKLAIISQLQKVMDSQKSAESYFIDKFAAGVFFTPEEMIELVKKVTVSDLVKIGETVKTDTIYFLCGEEDKSDDM